MTVHLLLVTMYSGLHLPFGSQLNHIVNFNNMQCNTYGNKPIIPAGPAPTIIASHACVVQSALTAVAMAETASNNFPRYILKSKTRLTFYFQQRRSPAFKQTPAGKENEAPFPWLTVSSWRPFIFAAEYAVEQRKYELHDVRGAKTSTMWIPTVFWRLIFEHSASFPKLEYRCLVGI
jgi:hypothetical protein